MPARKSTPSRIPTKGGVSRSDEYVEGTGSPSRVLPFDDRQGDARRMTTIMHHDLIGDHRAVERLLAERPAGVQVPVPLREVAARDVDADAVTGPEHVSGGAEVDAVFVDLVRRDEPGAAE